MRKEYYIPTIEVMSVQTKLMQDFGIMPSGSMGQLAPPRRDPAF